MVGQDLSEEVTLNSDWSEKETQRRGGEFQAANAGALGGSQHWALEGKKARCLDPRKLEGEGGDRVGELGRPDHRGAGMDSSCIWGCRE